MWAGRPAGKQCILVKLKGNLELLWRIVDPLALITHLFLHLSALHMTHDSSVAHLEPIFGNFSSSETVMEGKINSPINPSKLEEFSDVTASLLPSVATNDNSLSLN